MHGDQEQLLWSHPMMAQLQQQLGAASVQLLDAALVPPSKGGPPRQVAVLAASVPSDGGDGQVRACAASMRTAQGQCVRCGRVCALQSACLPGG